VRLQKVVSAFKIKNAECLQNNSSEGRQTFLRRDLMTLTKILTLISCCWIHIIIGSIYAESILYKTITQLTGWNLNIAVTGFSLSILTLGLSAAFFRKFTQNMSLKKILSISAVLYIAFHSVLWLVISNSADSLFYLAVCILRGVPLGILYAGTVSKATELSKKYVGLCSGLVVMSFGLGSLLAAKIYPALIQTSVTNSLIYLFCSWLSIILSLSLFREDSTIKYSSALALIKNKSWQKLSAVFFLNICVGIILLSNLVNLTTNAGFDIEVAITLVGISGIFNGAGRIIFASAADYFGRLRTLKTAFLLQIFCAGLLFFNWQIGVLGIISIYGAGFALMPGICKEIFDDGTSAYSLLLSWWGIAGIFAPLIFLNFPHIEILILTSCIIFIISLTIRDTNFKAA